MGMTSRWTDPRKAILDRLSQLKDANGKPRTLYWLGEKLKEDEVMHPATLYTYMRGEKDTTGEKLFKTFAVLGLELTLADTQ